MVPTRLELVTLGLLDPRSNQLSYETAVISTSFQSPQNHLQPFMLVPRSCMAHKHTAHARHMSKCVDRSRMWVGRGETPGTGGAGERLGLGRLGRLTAHRPTCPCPVRPQPSPAPTYLTKRIFSPCFTAPVSNCCVLTPAPPRSGPVPAPPAASHRPIHDTSKNKPEQTTQVEKKCANEGPCEVRTHDLTLTRGALLPLS